MRSPQTLHDHDYCIQTIRNAGLTPESNMAKNPAGLRSFEYHCAHSYWAYREVCEAIFGEEGTRIAERVLDDFAAEYGKRWQTRWQDMQGRILISQTKKSAALQKELLKYCC